MRDRTVIKMCIRDRSCVVIVGGEKPDAGAIASFQEILDRCDAGTGNMETDQAESGPADLDQAETRRTGEDLALILCTSGTTSGTKGVLLTHNNIRYSEEVFTLSLIHI